MSGTCHALVRGLNYLQAWLQQGEGTDYHERATMFMDNNVVSALAEMLQLVRLAAASDMSSTNSADWSSLEQLLTATLELSAWLVKGLRTVAPSEVSPFSRELFRLLQEYDAGRISTAHAAQLCALTMAVMARMRTATLRYGVPPSERNLILHAAGMLQLVWKGVKHFIKPACRAASVV